MPAPLARQSPMPEPLPLQNLSVPTGDTKPTWQDLATIKPGFSVKLCRGDERLWVVVISIMGDRIVGSVDNHLARVGMQPSLVNRVIAFDRRFCWDVIDHWK